MQRGGDRFNILGFCVRSDHNHQILGIFGFRAALQSGECVSAQAIQGADALNARARALEICQRDLQSRLGICGVANSGPAFGKVTST